MADRWFLYTITSVAALPGVVWVISIQLFDQLHKFQASSLRWPSFKDVVLIAVRIVGAFVRSNAYVLTFLIILGVATVGVWWGSRIENIALTLNSFSLVVLVIAVLVPFHGMARTEPVILIGAVPAFAIASLYIVIEEPRLPLLSSAPATIFLWAWTPTQYWALQLRKKWISLRRMGPFIETLTFVLLALPWVAATYAFPAIFIKDHDQTVSLCVTVLMGLVWSKLISDPFAKFVRSIL